MSAEATTTASTLKPTDLVIRVNNILTNDPCALCAAPTDPTGLDLFRADAFALVCHACGLLHAPALVRLLNLASAANTFVRAEYEMAGIATDEKSL